jgi:ketosteroid isomerase-like protein
MKIAFRLVLLAAVAVLGFWLWTVFFPSPEKVVLKKIASLAATATISANDSNLTRAGKASHLVGFFAADAQIIFDAPGQGTRTLSGRDEIREAALGGFASLTMLKVQFLDVSVRIGADKQTADVNCTAKVNAGDSKDFGVQEMHFQLKKIDGNWLITRAETVKTLS